MRSPHPRDVDAIEQHRQLGAVELRSDGVVIEGWHAKATCLEAFVEDDETAVVPGQNLHAVTAARDEDEEVACVDVLLPGVHHDGHQAINAVAHVDRMHGDQHLHYARQEQHGLPQRPDEVGHVPRRSSRLEAKANTTELELDQARAPLDARWLPPRQQRGRGYQLDRQKLLLRTGLRPEFLGLAVEPILECVERHVVSLDEVFLRHSALLVFGN